MLHETQAEPPAPQFDHEPLTAEERVYAWRLISLMEAGLDLEHAIPIAMNRTQDLHQACRAVRAGCKPLMAVALFGPLLVGE